MGGRRTSLRLAPEIEAMLAAIPIVESRGDQLTACLRVRKPKQRYTSAANARRGALAWSWAYGQDVPSATAVYECRWCDFWHTGTDWSLVARSA